jgi:ubiquinone/menaquinone biosynthesis C-methylase UbiE
MQGGQQMIRAVELYTFLDYCNNSPLEKEVLECGAGISATLEPLLVRFFDYGYDTHGIEISDERLMNAQNYCEENELDLDIREGDMRQIPFEDASLSFVFSYNTIFHMTKEDVEIAMGEIERVLKSEGLCFVNFLSVDSQAFGQGKPVGKGSFVEQANGMEFLHTYFEDHEPDECFAGFEILHKEKRIRETSLGEKRNKRAYIDYIAMKR